MSGKATILPIRAGLKLTADVQREALDWFKDKLAEYGGAEMIGVCFTIHMRDGLCTSFAYAAPEGLPHAMIEAQAAVVLAHHARQSSCGE